MTFFFEAFLPVSTEMLFVGCSGRVHTSRHVFEHLSSISVNLTRNVTLSSEICDKRNVLPLFWG